MNVLKRVLILLICVYCLKLLLFADANSNEWPKLFSKEIWIVILDETGRYELKSKIDDEKMINDNISTNEIKWWMMESFGYGYGKAKYDQEIVNNLLKVLNQIAWKVQEKIDNCQILQNMYGDKITRRNFSNKRLRQERNHTGNTDRSSQRSQFPVPKSKGNNIRQGRG